jgi:hypothetical protein
MEKIDLAGIRTLKKGDYTVVWAASGGKDPGAVLAYEKDAPKQGGCS